MILESSLIFASHGNQIGLVKLVQGYRLSTTDGHNLSTKGETKRSIKLKMKETALQVIQYFKQKVCYLNDRKYEKLNSIDQP